MLQEADVLCDDRNKQDSEITPSTSGVVQVHSTYW